MKYVFQTNNSEDLNLNVFNMITGINELKIKKKHASCKCECKVDSRKRNLYLRKW